MADYSQVDTRRVLTQIRELWAIKVSLGGYLTLPAPSRHSVTLSCRSIFSSTILCNTCLDPPPPKIRKQKLAIFFKPGCEWTTCDVH